MAKIPEEIEQFQSNYREGTWQEYSEGEYFWWVRLLVTRATHRTGGDKKLKDLIDARNYLLMWIAVLES